MKYLVSTILLLCMNFFSANSQITSYSDKRLPSDLITKIDAITVDSFAEFLAEGTQEMTYNKVRASVKYSVSYSSGFISGNIIITAKGSDKALATFTVKLRFKYCCNHNPSHCFSSTEEMKESKRKYGCTAWTRAEVE